MRFFKYILLAAVTLCTVSCFTQKVDYDGKPLVLATTGMIADIVRNIGGDFVVVDALMASGIDPHSHKASERDIIKLANASLILHNGLHLEGKLGEVLSRAQGSIPVYTVSEYIPESMLIKVSEQEADPHIWFDPELWVYAVKRVADSLVEIDPANAIYYRKNEDNYIQQLLALNVRVKKRLDNVPIKARVLVTSHDAFSYFGRAYGWEVIGIQGINTASETSVYGIQALAKTIVQRGISCIFAETSVSTRSVEAIIASAAAMGVELRQGRHLYSDSLGHTGTGADTYIGMMEYNADAIITGVLGI